MLASVARTTDQEWALARLAHLLARRAAVERDPELAAGPDGHWLVRALDGAIVSAYTLARDLEVGEEAEALMREFREREGLAPLG